MKNDPDMRLIFNPPSGFMWSWQRHEWEIKTS